MESLRAWVLLLAGTAFAAAAVGALLPESGSKRAFRVLCAVALLYVCLLPLRGFSVKQAELDALLASQAQQEASLSERADEAAVLAAQTLLETRIRETLTQNGLADCTVRVRCEAFDDGVAPAQITVHGSFSAQTVRQLLSPFVTPHTELILETEAEDDG